MDLAPVRTLLGDVFATLDGREPWQLGDEEILQVHTSLRQGLRVLGCLGSELLGDVDMRGLALGKGFQKTERWLAVTQCIDLGTARAELVVARRTVVGQLPTVTEGWSAGELDGPRAAVVAGTVETLNAAEVAVEEVRAAEELLASHGARLAPGALSKVAKAVLARLVLPGDPRPDDPLTRRFTVASSGIGGETFSSLSGSLDQVGTESVLTALDAFTADRGEDRWLCEAQRRGQALVAMADFALSNLTAAGPGVPARQVVVTVPLAVLAGEPGVGQAAWTGPVSAEVARRVACDAGVSAVTLGAAGEVLDVGRARRFVTDRLRTALVVRDQGCVWPGCDRPSSQTEAHHLVPWAVGGGTSLENLASFCAWHHHRLHAGEGWSAGVFVGVPFVRPPRSVDPAEPMWFHPRFLASRVGLAA